MIWGKPLTVRLREATFEIGTELAHKYKENPIVVNAIASHHGDVEPESVIAVIVAAADALSSARPGARNESMENYIKRLVIWKKLPQALKVSKIAMLCKQDVKFVSWCNQLKFLMMR